HFDDGGWQWRAERLAEPEFVDRVGGAAIGARLAEQAARIACRIDLLMLELSSDRVDERAERRRQRQELDFGPAFLGVVVERRLDAVEVEIAEADLVVVIFDRAGPIANDVDGRAFRPKLAFARVFHLVDGDARPGLRP